MLYYEWKKIWVKPGTKIAMTVLVGVLILVCCTIVHNVYDVNENGEREYGIRAVHTLKEAKKEWKGILTEEVIAEVIAENKRIRETPYGQSDNVRESNIAYGWGQGIEDIRWMLVSSCCKFREGDYYKPDRLLPEDAADFYGNRLLHLQEWLSEESQQYLFSEDERAFLLKRYESLPTPFAYDYAEGWKQLFECSAMMIMPMMLVLSFVSAGIFAGEFTERADAIFYTSYHGRGKAVTAKLGAGVLFVSVVYFAMMFLYTAFTLLFLGADGADLLIQTNHTGWKSFYFLTNGQEYLLILCGGYLGTLFFTLLAMLVSAGAKSKALAAIVPFVILFLPSFMGDGGNSFVRKMLGLWPDRLLDIAQEVSIFDLCHIGGKVVGAIPVHFALYTALSLALGPFICRIYRNRGGVKK